MIFGKIIGGLIGFFSGGIIGALVGLFVGSMFDKAFSSHQQQLTPEQLQNIQETFFKTTFTLIGYLAKADGRVSQEEIDQTQSLMEQMGLTADHKREAIRLFKIGAVPEFDPQAILAEFHNVCGKQPKLPQTLMVYLVNTALADGELDPKEESALRDIANALHFSTFGFEQLIRMIKAQRSFSGNSGYYQQQSSAPTSEDQLKSAYDALGVKPEDSDAAIKKAYRKLMSEYHPDKLMGQGVPDDMIKVATERSQEVQTAYDLIKKVRKQK